MEYLDLSHNLIRDVATATFSSVPNLKYLFLRSNNLTRLRANMFQNNHRLQDLHLDQNNISTIEERAFNGLNDLLTLFLSSNNLSDELAKGRHLFATCTQLRTLMLRNCQLSYLHKETFSGLRNLHELDLSDNHLNVIPEDIFSGLQHLSSLYLENNKLHQVSKAWGLPHTLKMLSLFSNEISEIKDGSFDGIDLSFIFLNSNKLETLPTMVQLYLSTRHNVTLSQNPWRCDCDIVFLVHHVRKQTHSSSQITCASPRRIRMSSLNETDIVCPTFKKCPSSSCSPCPRGLQRRVDGMCVCMEGTYRIQGLGKTGCAACPAHHYKPAPGNAPCVPCSHGSMPIAGPAPVCACAVGYFTNQAGDCEKCPFGTFKSYVGVGPCTRCTASTSHIQQCAQAKSNQTAGPTQNFSRAAQKDGDVVSVIHHREDSKVNVWPIVTAATVVVVICVVVVLLFFGRHYRAKRRLIKRFSGNMNARSSVLHVAIEETQFSSGSSHNSIDFRCNTRHSLRIKDIGNMIGRGAFGQVYEANAYLNSYDKEPVKVAIKKLKELATDEEIKNLRDELEQMLNVGPHPNIIGLFGSSVYEGQLCIVMEYAELGDLLTYLRTECTFPLQYVRVGSDGLVVEQSAPQVEDNANLMMFAWQIAKGMRHLELHRFIHRDLAARNCLLTKGPIAKVSDFGLSKDAYELGHYKRVQKDRVPFKWLSPEALLWGQYSSKSDVWAFGVLLWELYTFGGTPYPQVTTEQLRELHENGYRMSKPPACPEQLYRIMRACWREDPRQRPSFKQLEETLDILIQQTNGREYLDLHPHGLKASNPLPLTPEDMDDQKTSLEFVHRNKKQSGYQSRHSYPIPVDVTPLTYSTLQQNESGDIAYDETFPMLADVNCKTSGDHSNETTVTSGFQSMSSAQTM